MSALLDSNLFSSVVYCAGMLVVFLFAWRHLKHERARLAAINSYILMKYRLGMKVELKTVAKPVVDDILRVEDAGDPMRRQTSLDGMWKRAVRLESSVDFWVDLLQKLGLLGTVLGIGLSLVPAGASEKDLLAPLSLAVWSTVIGLVCGIAISWRFGRDVDVEVDSHEEHLKEWQAALSANPAAKGSLSQDSQGSQDKQEKQGDMDLPMDELLR